MSATPEVCICGRHATGIGFAGRKTEDNRWLCVECIPLLEYIKDVRRWDVYELKAIDAVDEATGDYAASIGKTDIVDFSDEERTGLWRCAVRSYQDGLRRLLKSGDAPW